MKHRMLALILALTVASWAQTATQTAPSDPQQSSASAEKGKCACCDKMASADSKDGQASCMRHEHGSASGKETDSCCGGKDTKSCMKGDKSAASCCKDGCAKDKTASASCGKDCGKKCGKDCCSSKKENASMECCKHEARS